MGGIGIELAQILADSRNFAICAGTGVFVSAAMVLPVWEEAGLKPVPWVPRNEDGPMFSFPFASMKN
ncbi:hypothetical protein CNECB9_740008 [Cupriavidus necator]|uniref:Uncharacterized protein n=1 Tax=Cupriavidus necator TaxID=106590 RepID=A0A1K0IRN9_CUPNE|nr:hypothetical protein CNECB9_740008 [Cupriavidus necator]